MGVRKPLTGLPSLRQAFAMANSGNRDAARPLFSEAARLYVEALERVKQGRVRSVRSLDECARADARGPRCAVQASPQLALVVQPLKEIITGAIQTALEQMKVAR
jgi:hypothetical protein